MKKKIKTTFLLAVMVIGLFTALSASTTPANAGSLPTRLPRIVVFSGNGAYHTSVEGFKANATGWGYEVFTTNYLEDFVLEKAEILILNAPDFLTAKDNKTIETWWNTGGKTLWVVGESDYGGYWAPDDLNELIVNLGGNVIIVDDAISDPVSQDGASYRVVCNVTNTADAEAAAVLGTYLPAITNISQHGPTAVAPWTGTISGNKTKEPGANATWADLATATWVVNSSKFAAIQDQDGDDDDVWEGPQPLVNQSSAMVAIEWGLAGGNKMIYTGESIFADYKEMFGYYARYANHSIQNINLTRGLLEWAFTAVDVDVPLNEDAKTPIVTVFSGNGAYHTSMEGFVKNATLWGYTINPIVELSYDSLTFTDVLILNAPDFLTADDNKTIEAWWKTGGKVLWVVGESDYGGYWNPADLNELIVNLGGNVIIVDDAISDPVSQDGASYRVVCNVTNTADAEAAKVLGTYVPAITNISQHGPTAVAPWTGGVKGNKTAEPGANATWDSLATATWVVNSSKFAAIQDQDGDDDDVWEGPQPLINQSSAMVAIEWGLAGGNKMIYTGESIFADYKEMFGYRARYANHSIQNINLTRGLLEWAIDPSVAPAKTRPIVYVWSGNGAYHTSVEGFIKNATVWGYDVFASSYWVDIILEMSDILILNAPDFLTSYDKWLITHWWNSGNRTLWFVGESDYGGYWAPTDLNELIVTLGGNVILVDDAISDPVSQDGASYRVICNVTNTADAEAAKVLGTYSPAITNISQHGPTAVAPWTGTISGNKTKEPGANATWGSLATATWVVNSSKFAAIQDQDGDDDDVWEGPQPLINQSSAMVAIEWDMGVWGESKMIYTGESIFADYKEMFGYEARYANHSIQNINLTHGLLEWCKPTTMRYYQIKEDIYAPVIEFTGDNTHEVSDADYIADNEEFTVTFNVHDYPTAYSGISDLWFEYSNGTMDWNATVEQTGFNSYTVSFGPFDQGTDLSYFVYVKDRKGFWTMSDTEAFSVDYSDTLSPNATVTLMKGFATVTSTSTVYTTEAVNVVVTTPDIADEDEVVSGFDSIVIEYSTDGGNTWIEAIKAGSGTSYTATLAGFDADTTIQVRVTVKDKAGNSETIDAGSFTVTAAPIVTTTTTVQPIPGFEILFGFIALMGLAVFISRRRKR